MALIEFVSSFTTMFSKVLRIILFLNLKFNFPEERTMVTRIYQKQIHFD